MKKKIKFLVLCGNVAVAAAVSAEYSNPLEIDLQTGVTNTLSGWLSANSKQLGNYAELVKKGDGCLKIDAAFGFAGDIHVENGTVWPMVTGALGDENGGKVTVHDGGRLYYDTTGSSESINPSFYGKKFFIEGDGGDGLGAVLSRCRADGSTRLLGSNLTLTANAKISTSRGRFDFPSTMELDLGGNTLTIANVLGGSGLVFCYGGAKVHEGHIIADKCQFLHQSTANYIGDSSNTITFTNGASLAMYNFMGKVFWTAKFAKGSDTSAIVARHDGTDSNGNNRWDGPIVLEKDVLLSHGDKSGMILAGKIGGSAGFTTDGNDRRKNFTVSITNPENEMTGESVFDAITLKVPVDGALPESMAGVEFRGTHVVFQEPESNVVYSLPPAEFTGTGIVSRGYGTWKDSLVKKGDGLLEYTSMIGADLLDVQGGTVRFAHPAPGLHEGTTVVEKDAQPTVGALFNSELLITNNVAGQLNWAYRCSTKDGWKPRMLATYSGYIWNRSGEFQNWTFAGCVFEGAKVFLDGKKVLETYAYNNGDWKGAKKATVEVGPGAHAFTVKLYTTSNVNDSNWGGAYPKPLNEGWVWTNKFGVVLDRQGRGSTNCEDYEKIADPGDGSLLTTSSNLLYTAETGPVFTAMKFAPGTGIDLRDGTYEVPHLIGWPSVSSGSLTVKEDWTLPANQIQDNGAKLAVADGKLTFAETAKVVIDVSEGRHSLESGSEFAVATASDGINRVPAVESSFPGYRLKMSAGGNALLLKYDNGLKVILR